MLLVCRFSVSPPAVSDFTARADAALALLAAQPGFRGGETGCAIEDPQQWVLTVRFDSVDAYRRALSPFAVREHVHPLLAEADTTTEQTYETRLSVGPGSAVEHHPSLLTG